jgi:hypothetical protein
MSPACPGWVPERSIGHAWKACVPQGTEGSNPSPSATPEIKDSESTLLAFRLVNYVAVHEMAKIFVVPRASSGGLGTRFNLLSQPGGNRAGRG